MKSKTEMKKDGKEFERFDDLLRHVVSVPKEEINKREKEHQKRKDRERKKKG